MSSSVYWMTTCGAGREFKLCFCAELTHREPCHHHHGHPGALVFFVEGIAHHFVAVALLPHFPDDNGGDGGDHHQHPDHGQQPHHGFPSADASHPLWPEHRQHPVDAHHHDELDGGVHVEQAQVEEDLAHGLAERPVLGNQVGDEERRESHQGAVGDGQVEDDEGGDGVSLGTGEDAPDDEEVSRETQQEDDAQDERAHGGALWVVPEGVVAGAKGRVDVGHVSPLKRKKTPIMHVYWSQLLS